MGTEAHPYCGYPGSSQVPRQDGHKEHREHKAERKASLSVLFVFSVAMKAVVGRLSRVWGLPVGALLAAPVCQGRMGTEAHPYCGYPGASQVPRQDGHKEHREHKAERKASLSVFFVFSVAMKAVVGRLSRVWGLPVGALLAAPADVPICKADDPLKGCKVDNRRLTSAG